MNVSEEMEVSILEEREVLICDEHPSWIYILSGAVKCNDIQQKSQIF